LPRPFASRRIEELENFDVSPDFQHAENEGQQDRQDHGELDARGAKTLRERPPTSGASRTPEGLNPPLTYRSDLSHELILWETNARLYDAADITTNIAHNPKRAPASDRRFPLSPQKRPIGGKSPIGNLLQKGHN
jgi:hypothetical protein